jgi:hypothetical protein
MLIKPPKGTSLVRTASSGVQYLAVTLVRGHQLYACPRHEKGSSRVLGSGQLYSSQ